LTEYDLIILGAGTSGLPTARLAANKGKKVLLIENNLFGGDCTNFGCIPSKTLIASSKVAHDIKRAKDAVKNDPFVQHHKEWQRAIKKLVGMKVRAEQQALAKWGLNYVIDKYLPNKLKNQKTWLP